ncbi:MAG: cytochrome c biogenesis protein [Phycisphaerales bacterium]
MFRHALLLLLSCLLTLPASGAQSAPEPDPGLTRLGEIAVQDGGRTMPLEAYAKRLAVDVTGRTKWSSGGPPLYSGRQPMQLLLDAMFKGESLIRGEIVTIDDKPFKGSIGLDPERRFFSPSELANTKGLNDILMSFEASRANDPQAKPDTNQRKALNIRQAANRIANLASGEPIAIVPSADGPAFGRVSAVSCDPGLESVQAAWTAIGTAYRAGQPLDSSVSQLEQAVAAFGKISDKQARAVRLEVFYDRHQPFRKTAVFYALAMVLLGVSRLVLKKPLAMLAIASTALGVVEHAMGVGLRILILERAPVSNTYESLIWMGLVGIAAGLIAQLVNRGRGWYLFGGIAAAFISVLFAGLVPITDQTNSLPAVLRSNFWLTVHVLTIVASYGVLVVASVLGHAYLIKDVLLRKQDAGNEGRSAALVVQTYRTIQIGLFLLTAGTILGGVWASESWGRFWGWDPKETWALISIIAYFAVLHARYVRWIEDFGLAASAVLGMVVIVWTFYGVNYVMATGLHSYGFGSGGELYVGIWALIEIAFIVLCWIRHKTEARSVPTSAGNSHAVGASSAV